MPNATINSDALNDQRSSNPFSESSIADRVKQSRRGRDKRLKQDKTQADSICLPVSNSSIDKQHAQDCFIPKDTDLTSFQVT